MAVWFLLMERYRKKDKKRKLEEGMMIDKDGQIMDKNGKLMDTSGWD
jgi:hypothetical protein